MSDENRNNNSEPFEYGNYPSDEPTPKFEGDGSQENHSYETPRYEETQYEGNGVNNADFGGARYEEPQYGNAPQYGNDPQYGADQQQYNNEPYQYHEPERPQSNGKGLAIASLVLGICALVTTCFYINIILGIVGIVLGIIFLRKGEEDGRGMAIAGIILSIISLVIFLILFIVGMAAISMYGLESFIN